MPLPEQSISSQIYNGLPIQCAMFYCPIVTRFRIKDACQMNESYYFEAVMRSTTNQTITVICGDKSEDIDITDTFQRYTKFFPDVDVSNDQDAYIVFPIGTYFLYNVQIEVATTPSAWRPAPEDAEDYADQVAQYAVDSQTQKEIFDKLTADGTAQGIYMVNGQLYINGSYIATGTLDASQVNVINLNASNITSGTISANKVSGGTLSGSQINIGNGTFTVNSSGNVVANSLSSSNANITGGSINIDSGTTSIDKINLTYFGGENNMSSTGIKITQNPTATRGKYETTIGSSGYELKFTSVDGNTTQEVTVSPTLIQLKMNGVTRVSLSTGSASGSNASGSLKINDPNGTNRLWLDYDTGLTFRNASGVITKQYGVS